MYAKNLERILGLLCEHDDISHSLPDEYAERFKSLRGSALLPRGRERREERLSFRQVAAALFGLVPSRPSWAALGAIILSDLRPVGGIGASFFEAETLSGAVQLLLSEEVARKSFIRLTVTVAETGTNSNGGAVLRYESNGERRQVFFVPKLAVSLLAPGREVGFDPEKHRLNAAVAREIKEEKIVKFDRYTLVLFPKTEDHVQSVHMDLMANRLDHPEAMTVINRFLSIMVWCDDNFAIAEDGWSGNPVPVPVPKPDLAFTTAYDYVFDRKLPASEDAMRALALYREARNAQQNAFVSYAVLNFYKIVEMRNHGKETVRSWFRENFEALRQANVEADEIKRFLDLCKGEPPHKYIHDSCRLAVAHAGKRSKSDPDDANEILRLHTAASVMHLLARRFIKNEFVISDLIYSGD